MTQLVQVSITASYQPCLRVISPRPIHADAQLQMTPLADRPSSALGVPCTQTTNSAPSPEPSLDLKARERDEYAIKGNGWCEGGSAARGGGRTRSAKANGLRAGETIGLPARVGQDVWMTQWRYQHAVGCTPAERQSRCSGWAPGCLLFPGVQVKADKCYSKIHLVSTKLFPMTF